ncbi:MAG: cell surface protein SprA, partial [Flavobacteriaceae bacterium]
HLSFGQEEEVDLGQIPLPKPSALVEQYTYDPILDRYVFSASIANYPMNTPLILTPQQFEQLQVKEAMNTYFKSKIGALSGTAENIDESRKNLLPELYVNNKFFQSIFGGNTIDVSPQGSIGIDLGARYQRTDNPAASPRNRRNFGFDFDQRISLSLLGNIGERLQITANYDTESTFDFQNVVKIQFNPPKIDDAFTVQPDQLPQGFENLQNKASDAASKLESVEGQINEAAALLEQTKDKINALREKSENLRGAVGAFQSPMEDFLNGQLDEDGILQSIDVGNVSMPINSSLIQGAQNLFGIRADLKIGKTQITGVFSEQRSQSQRISAQGGGTLQDFSFFALDYEEDRHFFLAQFFRDQYDRALSTYPYINSQVQITRIEVWVTNRSAQTQNIRNVVALQDLGEANPERTRFQRIDNQFFNVADATAPPSNTHNRLNPLGSASESILTDAIRDIASVKQGFGTYANQVLEGYDYAVLESARKLNPNEYRLNPQLGYISLNQRLSNDEILGVAFQFTYRGEVYQVGEFANGGVPGTTSTASPTQQAVVQNNSLVVKMLKSSVTDVRQPVWDLMMKNIYNTGAYQIAKEDFKLNIFYTDPSPINYINPIANDIWPEELNQKILLNTFQLDRLNAYRDPVALGDGFFDFIPGTTIDPEFGTIIFPMVEPFGAYLFEVLDDPNSGTEQYADPNSYNPNQEKYVFQEMYALTKAAALEAAEKNKFQMKGRYTAEGGDGIPLGAFNVPRGSVQVRAGGRILREGLDYTVNYDIGRVKILDPALKASNTPIDISVENNSFFNQQTKRFSGVNVVHQVNENFVLGGTLLNLSENPLTQKANYGTEPVNNTMFGFNTTFSTELPFLTRLINRLPNLQSDTPSYLSFRGEVARLKTGNPRLTQLQGEASVYLDDFEGAQTSIDIRSPLAWRLSSVPIQGVDGAMAQGLESGFHRAKLAWYTIDPIFYTTSRPSALDNNSISLNTTRRIFIQEIFPEQDLVQGTTTVQNTLDLAYYPTEKGPYNNAPNVQFDSQPQTHWGAIMRPLSATNFEQSNVEFIEFWLLDTFSDLEAPTDDLGQLEFHLGNLSEDILADGRKQFENGLPGANSDTAVYETAWGKVPSGQSLLYAFNTDANDRPLQDVGLDGLTDAEEAQIYDQNNTDDPAGDNYEYFVQASGNLLERYKKYNGTQGNSPLAFSDTNRGSTTEPDTEDINRDQSMNTIESYFSYQIPIRKAMQVGNHPFVTDVREEVQVRLPNGRNLTTRWIQFKIPVQKQYYQGTSFQPFFEAVNGINDLRSVRFMRMLLKGFDQPVVLRFGTLDLVRGDWRRYQQALNPDEVDYLGTTVDISTVNILENENRVPINYVLPPDIRREQVNNNNTIVRQNEQALSFRVNQLRPRDSRAVFKNVDLDLRQYKKLRMFLHAESLPGRDELPGAGATSEYNNRVVAFIRLGTDYKDNYYQIEIPLKPTAWDTETSNRYTAEQVWIPEENALEVPLEWLTQMKSKAIGSASAARVAYYDQELNRIQEFDPIGGLPGDKKYKLAIKGNPTLGAIRTLMIGVKNPGDPSGRDLSGEVWFNELRISGIDNKDGWAAVGALDVNLADFADVSATGRYTSIGFGALDQSPNQIQREGLKQYDLVTNVNVGQLFPQKWGLQIPLNLNTGVTTISPEYDPVYQDLRLEDRLEAAETPQQRKRIEEQAVEYSERNSISLIGVRKNKTGNGKTRLYSPENFDFSYAYNRVASRNFEIEDQQQIQMNLGANYQYSFPKKEIQPFKNTKFLKKKYLQWLQQFNFNLLPSNLSLQSQVNRNLTHQRFREVFQPGVEQSIQRAMPSLQQRNFLFDWEYNLNYNLTQSLRLNFTGATNNILKFTETELATSDAPQKEIWEGVWNMGTPNQYFQTLSLNYRLPFQYIPILSFINANYNYTADFNWQRGSDVLGDVTAASGETLGIVNTVQNANTKTLSGDMSFERLYTALGIKPKPTAFNQRLAQKTAVQDSTKPKSETLKKVLKGMMGVLDKFKRVQFNYAENNGTVLPGYLPQVGFGQWNIPQWQFIFGDQTDIRYATAQRGWLTEFPDFNPTFTKVHNSKLTLSAQLQPLNGLLVELNAERNYSENTNENFRVEQGRYQALNPNTTGNFGISTLLIRTAFRKVDKDFNPNFERFRDYRATVAQRLASSRGVGGEAANDFPEGYGPNQQEVMIGAFLAAYTGGDPKTMDLNPVRKTPLPNWNLKYTGLMQIKSLQKIFNRFSLSHGYRSSITLNSFRTNLDYDLAALNQKDPAGNFLSERIYANVNLVEQFNPLVRVDFELKNSLNLLMEMKRDRALSLSLDNSLLTETSGNEFILGAGYRLQDLRWRTRFGGRRVTLSGDLNLKADVSYRTNLTVLRNLEYDNNQVTAGQTQMSIKFTADYALSKNLTALFFYDHNFSEFAVSTAFPQTSIRSGFTIRYNFGN